MVFDGVGSVSSTANVAVNFLSESVANSVGFHTGHSVSKGSHEQTITGEKIPNWVIPDEINKEYRLTSWILLKFG